MKMNTKHCEAHNTQSNCIQAKMTALRRQNFQSISTLPDQKMSIYKLVSFSSRMLDQACLISNFLATMLYQAIPKHLV